jgi:hypothetical protein
VPHNITVIFAFGFLGLFLLQLCSCYQRVVQLSLDRSQAEKIQSVFDAHKGRVIRAEPAALRLQDLVGYVAIGSTVYWIRLLPESQLSDGALVGDFAMEPKTYNEANVGTFKLKKVSDSISIALLGSDSCAKSLCGIVERRYSDSSSWLALYGNVKNLDSTFFILTEDK